jgi:electron transfer DM13
MSLSTQGGGPTWPLLTASTNTRQPRRILFAILSIGLVALLVPLVWYLGSPLFVSRAVSEGAPSAAGATGLLSGHFGVVDGIHKGEGATTIVRMSSGQRVLRLEDDFRVTNGPDLYVYLSANPAPRSSSELHAMGAFEVAQLKGNLGGQNYALPDDLDVSSFRSVVIYCKRFTTVFSTAELER